MVAPFAVEAKIDTLLLLSGNIVAPLSLQVQQEKIRFLKNDFEI